MPDPITLKCPECSHLNEPERVYCHQCGAKLDRSLLPKPSEKKETPEETRRRVTRMGNPTVNWAVRDAKTLFKILLLAAAVAAIGLFWLPPEGAPEKTEEIGTSELSEMWQRQMSAPGSTTVVYSQDLANKYLKTLKAGDSTVKFRGAFAKFTPEGVTIMLKRELWSLPLWGSVNYQPMSGGKFEPTATSVHLGRLGVPPGMSFAHSWGVGQVLAAIAKDFKGFERVEEVTVEEGKVTVRTKP